MRRIPVILLVVVFAIPPVQAQDNGYVRREAGDLPIILSAPHGGSLLPEEIPDRSCDGCVIVMDAFTQELADALFEALEQRTGFRPFLVASNLHRRKLDPNREIEEAALGNPIAEAAWTEYHETIEEYKADLESRFRMGLVLDLHGHAHTVQRIELGYLVDGETLRLDDAALDADRGENHSFRALQESHQDGLPLSTLIRGPESLGDLLVERGYPSVPSPADLAPLVGEPFFSGGYITRRHGSLEGGNIDAVQLELYREGIRSTDPERRAFAAALADALTEWFFTHHNLIIISQNSEHSPSDGFPTAPVFDVIPNPAHPSAKVQFRSDGSGPARLQVFDILGRQVHAQDTWIEPGQWIQTGFNAGSMAHGVYFVRLQTPHGTSTRSLVVSR